MNNNFFPKTLFGMMGAFQNNNTEKVVDAVEVVDETAPNDASGEGVNQFSCNQYMEMLVKMNPMYQMSQFMGMLCKMNPMMGQTPNMYNFKDTFKNMCPMSGMNQNPEGLNRMNPMYQMNQFMGMFGKMNMGSDGFCRMNPTKQVKNMFGMPVKALTWIMDRDSATEGFTEFQKFLDMIFTIYSNPRTNDDRDNSMKY